MDYTADKLASGIVNAIAFSSPEAVFLFGGLANAGDMLLEPVRKYVDMKVLPVFKNTFRIELSSIPENNAAILGASALVWNERSL